MKKFLVYPNQLFEQCLSFAKGTQFFLVEDPYFYGYDQLFSYSKQRWIYTRSCFLGFKNELQSHGHIVNLIDYKNANDWMCKELNENFSAFDPIDSFLKERLVDYKVQLISKIPQFLLSEEDFIKYESVTKKPFFQTNFYKFVRETTGILMTSNGKYKGGRLSFDNENRKPLDEKTSIPKCNNFAIDPESEDLIKESTKYVELNFPKLEGAVNIIFPVVRKAAYEHFEQFLKERFCNFGPYQDAIHRSELLLFHAGISPMLNNGLLDVQKVVNMACEQSIPITSQEGFIRQIIGWREYIRYVYTRKGDELRECNLLENHKKLDNRFYNGFKVDGSEIPLLNDAIRMCINYGYAHHIMRLMILCNFMVLCQIHPNEMYKWFMEHCHDAYDWVMIPNVFGMGYATDLVMTKPYVSGSNYILKMSKEKKTVNCTEKEWCQLWDSLYYSFLQRQEKTLGRNYRMSMMFSNLHKKENIGDLLKTGQDFINTFSEIEPKENAPTKKSKTK